MSKEWPRIKLSDHIDILIGGTPSRIVTAFWAKKPNGHPWMSISDMKSKYATDTKEQISDLGVRGSNVKLIPTGSTIMSFKLSVGRTAITTKEMYSNEAIAAFLPRNNRINSAWLYHVLPRAVKTVVTDTAVKGVTLNKEKMADMSVMLPCLTEQVKIAEILDNFDRIIQQTEAIIEKLKQVKQGLLHDLLTRGIDANGELRPPQSQAPHLYKDSLLGSIPRTWSVERLDGLLSNEQPAMRSGPFGSALLKSEQVESGVPLLGIDNVHTEEFIDKFTRFVPISKFHELSRYAVRPDDLMITIMGTVGRCCLVPSGIGRALSSKHTWTITLDQSKYSPLLAMLQINYSLRILEQLARDEQGGIMSAIRSDTLRSLNFPVPPIKEQIEMAERMQAITSRINTESEVLRKLTCEKLGLMDDLLTGRVRVTPLLETLGA